MRTPVVDLAAAVTRKEISPTELVEACLDGIERLNPQINAFVTVAADSARAEARAAEDRLGQDNLPPFLGIPLAVKDLHLTDGMRTTMGTAALADYVPDFDDEHVARLRRAGYIFIGKTNVPEFGSVPYTESQLHGPCRNPWDLSRTTGGSSGGSAAALAAGLVPAATGSDGGGSCRIPAANCGIVGVKPSRGRVSSGPLFGDVPGGLSTPGPLSHHVVDAAAMLDVMQGYATGDPHWAPPPSRPYVMDAKEDPEPLRIGLLMTSPLGTFAPDTISVTEDAARLLEKLGHSVEPVPDVGVDESFKDHFETVWACGIAALPIPTEFLEPFNAALRERGTRQSGAQVMEALAALQLSSRAIIGATSAYDVVVTPTMMREPLAIGELADIAHDAPAMFDALTQYIGLTPVANVTGQPSMSLPLGFSDNGLPLGVMFTGRPADEATLFRLAGQIQRAADWTQRRPPLVA